MMAPCRNLSAARIAALGAACLLALTPRMTIAAPPVETPGQPQPPPTAAESALERGRLCFEAVDFACAEHELGVARHGPLSSANQVEVLRLLAEIHLGRDDRATARELCLELLLLQPDFDPPAWPETWRAVLNEARRLAPDRTPPRIVPAWPTPPATVPRGVALDISAEVSDPSGVARCELVVAPDGLRLKMRTDDGERWSTTIPAELVVPGLAVAVEAWDKVGNGPSRAPDAGVHAVVVAVPSVPQAPPSPPITSRWWFWTGLVVVAVGAGLGLGFAFAGDGATNTATAGDIRVVPQFPGQR